MGTTAPHPQQEALDVLERWKSMYALQGAEAPLPMTLVEDEYPELFEFFVTLLEEAGELHAQRFLREHPGHREGYYGVGSYLSRA